MAVCGKIFVSFDWILTISVVQPEGQRMVAFLPPTFYYEQFQTYRES